MLSPCQQTGAVTALQTDHGNLFRCHEVIRIQYINVDTSLFFPVNWWKAPEAGLKAAFGMEAVGFV